MQTVSIRYCVQGIKKLELSGFACSHITIDGSAKLEISDLLLSCCCSVRAIILQDRENANARVVSLRQRRLAGFLYLLALLLFATPRCFLVV